MTTPVFTDPNLNEVFVQGLSTTESNFDAGYDGMIQTNSFEPIIKGICNEYIAVIKPLKCHNREDLIVGAFLQRLKNRLKASSSKLEKFFFGFTPAVKDAYFRSASEPHVSVVSNYATIFVSELKKNIIYPNCEADFDEIYSIPGILNKLFEFSLKDPYNSMNLYKTKYDGILLLISQWNGRDVKALNNIIAMYEKLVSQFPQFEAPKAIMYELTKRFPDEMQVKINKWESGLDAATLLDPIKMLRRFIDR